MGEPTSESILVPSFEEAFWRSQQRVRYRDLPGYSRKKGHFEPEEASSYAARFAEELTRDESAAEIRQIYENAVVILGNRRSQMERGDRSLDCPQLRYAIDCAQDQDDPACARITRQLWIKIALPELPAHFDDLFPYRAEELVVPITGSLDRRAILVVLEDWEHALRARLTESADQHVYRLRLPSGFSLSVDAARRETSFSQEGASGVVELGHSVARNLETLRIRARP